MEPSIWFVWACLALLPKSCTSLSTVSLNGAGWTVADGSGTMSVHASTPTDVYLALYNAGSIPDPYANENDVALRNISRQNWTFTRSFSLTSDFSTYVGVILVSNGLDTVSTLAVNGRNVGYTYNMFRTYVFDVKSALNSENSQSNDEELKINFTSPVSFALNRASAYKATYGYSVPNDCPPLWQHGECHPNFIRKMQSSYSWDWGPAFPTMGVYKDLSVVGLNSCTVLQFSVVPVLNVGQNLWTLNVDFLLYCVQNVQSTSFNVNLNELNVQFSWNGSVTSGYNRIQYNKSTVQDGLVERWWPNGFGTQKLYTVTGSFSALDESDARSINVGFRTVELVQDPIGNFTDGLTFYFKINNQPIFLKGSNWIPADSFLSRITSDRLQFFFASMKQAYFNTLRVWGGGVYESEEFYDLADKNGIMIFQDMMFAVNLYPTNANFLANVKQEIFDQVNRLKHRPSIIVWAGNNENEAGLTSGWFKMDAPYDTYKSDYIKLYNDTVYAVINETDYYSRPFLMSSPSNGVNTTRSGGVDTNVYSTLYGDVHVYNYLADAWNPKNYPVPRCTTEYGFQGYPSVETLESAIPYDELGFFNKEILHRQHHPGGQLQLLEEIFMHFDLFSCSSKAANGKMRKFVTNVEEFTTSCKKSKASTNNGVQFSEMIYLTQVHQAMAYKTETEHYRRWRSTVNQSTGEGLTMCALYWQLNDIWQAPTWASIDYGLKWKMVHYYARNFFNPILVSAYVDGNNLKVSIINDGPTTLTDLTLLIDVHSWGSLQPHFHFKVKIQDVQPASAVAVYSGDTPTLIGTNQEDLDVFFNVQLQQGYQVLTPNSVVFPNNFKRITKSLLGMVTVQGVQMGNAPNQYVVQLKATAPAPFVWLDVKGVRGWFADNGFTMLTEYLQMTFDAWDNSTTLQQITDNISVTSLGDFYQ